MSMPAPAGGIMPSVAANADDRGQPSFCLCGHPMVRTEFDTHLAFACSNPRCCAFSLVPKPPAPVAGNEPVAAEPTIEELAERYPEVDRFRTRMLRELWANRDKGDQDGWRSMPLRIAWSEISWHVGKLAGAVKDDDLGLIRELAADVAVTAMMLDDIASILLAPERTAPGDAA